MPEQTIISIPLGKLEQVDVRTVWHHEALGFTPWLHQSDNLDILGNTIGIQLEAEGTEVRVGPFRADILCRDALSGHRVLIENQLEASDHNHLGQILTYAAGLEVNTVIWIAPKFTDQHRAAMDWLNRVSGEDYRFFGVEVQVWKIGNSPPAVRFELIAQPNEWSRAAQKASKTPSIAELQHLEYWKAFSEYVQPRVPELKVQPKKNRFQLIKTICPNARWFAYANENANRIEIQLWVGEPQWRAVYDSILIFMEQHVEETGAYKTRIFPSSGAFYFAVTVASVFDSS